MEKKHIHKSFGKWVAIVLYIIAGGFLGFRVASRAIDAGKSCLLYTSNAGFFKSQSE